MSTSFLGSCHDLLSNKTQLEGIDNPAVNDCCVNVCLAYRFSREPRQVAVEDHYICTHTGDDATGLIFLKPDPGCCLGEQTERIGQGKSFGWIERNTGSGLARDGSLNRHQCSLRGDWTI